MFDNIHLRCPTCSASAGEACRSLNPYIRWHAGETHEARRVLPAQAPQQD
jgi:hypothetical protein